MPSGGMPSSVGGADAGAVVATCVPIPAKPWVATANPSSITGVAGDSLYNPPPQAVDDNVNTRWSTGVGQSGGEWIEVDFGVPVTLTRVELDHAHSRTDLTLKADWPRGYSVSMSYTSRDFGAPEITHGEGTAGFTNIVFPQAATGRYLLIQQTEVDLNNWWSVHELTAFCGN
jgi:hypothetical protein